MGVTPHLWKLQDSPIFMEEMQELQLQNPNQIPSWASCRCIDCSMLYLMKRGAVLESCAHLANKLKREDATKHGHAGRCYLHRLHIYAIPRSCYHICIQHDEIYIYIYIYVMWYTD